jgi:putative selenate reductase molybdopterin-binding subunit
MEKAEGGRTVKTVNKPFRKKDAMQLVTGQPVYMDDIIPQDCLIVKLLRSPHANAIVRSINTAVAKKVPGIEAVFTWEDVRRMPAATRRPARLTRRPAPTTVC